MFECQACKHVLRPNENMLFRCAETNIIPSAFAQSSFSARKHIRFVYGLNQRRWNQCNSCHFRPEHVFRPEQCSLLATAYDIVKGTQHPKFARYRSGITKSTPGASEDVSTSNSEQRSSFSLTFHVYRKWDARIKHFPLGGKKIIDCVTLLTFDHTLQIAVIFNLNPNIKTNIDNMWLVNCGCKYARQINHPGTQARTEEHVIPAKKHGNGYTSVIYSKPLRFRWFHNVTWMNLSCCCYFVCFINKFAEPSSVPLGQLAYLHAVSLFYLSAVVRLEGERPRVCAKIHVDWTTVQT